MRSCLSKLSAYFDEAAKKIKPLQVDHLPSRIQKKIDQATYLSLISSCCFLANLDVVGNAVEKMTLYSLPPAIALHITFTYTAYKSFILLKNITDNIERNYPPFPALGDTIIKQENFNPWTYRP